MCSGSEHFAAYGSIWTFITITGIVSAICICSILSETYTERAFITVVDSSQYPVFNIEFPAVAVCTKHRINWGRFEQARKKFLPSNADNATVEMFTRLVKLLDSMTFGSFNNLVVLENEPSHLIDSISVWKVASYLAFRCEEVIQGTCMWSEQRFDCCSMFVQEKTSLGVCLVFNSIVTKESRQNAVSDKFYPLHNSKNGEGSGLVFTVKRNASNVVPGQSHVTGIDIMVKKYDQWTEGKTYHLRPNTYNAIIVRPQLTNTQPGLASLPMTIRKCLFRNERWALTVPGLKYRQLNCKSQCHHEHVIRACNCTIPMFFQTSGVKVRECTVTDYKCIYKNRDIFADDRHPKQNAFIKQRGRGMTCPCPNNCDSLNYNINLNTVPLYNESLVNTTTHIDIYYQSEVMMKYITTLKFSSLDLIGYFGGVLTLFLGASMMSTVEFGHFALIEMVSYLQEKARNKRMMKNSTPTTNE